MPIDGRGYGHHASRRLARRLKLPRIDHGSRVTPDSYPKIGVAAADVGLEGLTYQTLNALDLRSTRY